MAHELSSTTLHILNILNDSRLHTGTEITETYLEDEERLPYSK